MLARAGALDALDSNRRKVLREPRGADGLVRPPPTTSAPRRRSACSARPTTRCRRRGCRSPRTGRRWSGWRRSIRPSASTSPAIRSTTTPAALRRERVLTHAELVAQGGRRPRRRSPRSPAPSRRVDQRKSARGTRFAFVRLSDPTGLYEVRHVLRRCSSARATTSSPARSVVLTVEATLEGDELQAARQGGPADRPRGRRRRERRACGSSSTTPAAAASLASRLGAVAREAPPPAPRAGQPGPDASRAAGRGRDRAARALSDDAAGRSAR